MKGRRARVASPLGLLGCPGSPGLHSGSSLASLELHLAKYLINWPGHYACFRGPCPIEIHNRHCIISPVYTAFVGSHAVVLVNHYRSVVKVV